MTEKRGQKKPGGEGRTLLLVERDGVASSSESRELEAAGFRVLEAANPEAAEAALAGGGIDLVLMDASLDAAGIIGERDLPLLFLYSRADSAAVEKAASIPCYGFVARGEDAVVLSSSVSAALSLFASRRQLEENAEGLMKELQHRVKNGLNLASSLLRLQMDELEDERAKKAMHDAVSRLRAMAAIYEKLYRSSDLRSVDLGAYLKELSEAVFKAFAPEPSGLRLSVATAELRIDSNRGVYLGLILTELLTNAVKYAYPEDKGEIRVELALSGGEASLRVSDRGAGLPGGFDLEATTSLGLTLVSMLASQIGAELGIDREGGTRVSVAFAAYEGHHRDANAS